MRNHIYVSPTLLRLSGLGLLLALGAIIATQAPDIRRYLRFESM